MPQSKPQHRNSEPHFIDRMGETTQKVGDYLSTGQKRAQEVYRQTESNIKKYPWRSVGVAAVVGYLVGYLAKRK